MKLVAFLASALSHFDSPAVPPDPGRPPVVLVHGINATAREMERLARHLRSEGREVYVPTLMPNDGRVPIENLARQLADYTSRELRGRRFDLVGYSMGGLVSRYYLQRLGGLDRVQRFVTLATPHQGSGMARFSNSPGVLQMRPGSEFLRDLDRDAGSLRRVKFTSLHSPLDMVVPTRNGEASEARNVRMWSVVHPSFLLQTRGIRAVAQALRD